MPNPPAISDTAADGEENSLARAFHKLSRVIAENQRLVTLSPLTRVGEALEIMRSGNFSQVPVVVGSEVIGMFSHRTLAEGVVATAGGAGSDVAQLPIEEFLDSKVVYADIADDVRDIIGQFDRHDAILIGHKKHISALLTRDDVVHYLHRIAEPFMLLEEIERTTRLLMERSAPPDEIPQLISVRLGPGYHERGALPPAELLDLTLQQLIDVLLDGRNWPRFEQSFGGSRARAQGKFEGISRVRNEIFHFRAHCSDEAKQVLRTCRDWLLRRAQVAQELENHRG